MSMQNKKVDIIGVQLDLGASMRGVNMGPSAIRYAGLHQKLNELQVAWQDKGDILPLPNEYPQQNPSMKNFHQILDCNTRLYEAVSASLHAGSLPIVLGGDHSIAAGSISASLQYHQNIGLIWIDAHGDFNNEKTSPSGNMHGMPLSAVCGMGPDEMICFHGKTTYVDVDKTALVAVRDLDAAEKKRLKSSGIHVFSITDIDRLGMAEVMRQAITVASNQTQGFHVSFDIDAVTPQEAPGVGTPVHGGLTERESFLAAEMIAESNHLLSFDMVEVNPVMDERNKTALLACELILSLLGKDVY